MTIERIVAVQPSKRSSLTYGFFHTITINPGNARERRMSNAVAQKVLMTFTRREVKNVRIMRVSRSPNDDAKGVAMLSNVSPRPIDRTVIPGLIRNFRETRTREDMNELRTTLDRLAQNIELTIIRALSNHVSRCGFAK